MATSGANTRYQPSPPTRAEAHTRLRTSQQTTTGARRRHTRGTETAPSHNQPSPVASPFTVFSTVTSTARAASTARGCRLAAARTDRLANPGTDQVPGLRMSTAYGRAHASRRYSTAPPPARDRRAQPANTAALIPGENVSNVLLSPTW